MLLPILAPGKGDSAPGGMHAVCRGCLCYLVAAGMLYARGHSSEPLSDGVRVDPLRCQLGMHFPWFAIQRNESSPALPAF